MEKSGEMLLTVFKIFFRPQIPLDILPMRLRKNVKDVGTNIFRYFFFSSWWDACLKKKDVPKVRELLL